jgi:AAA domain-containing protein
VTRRFSAPDPCPVCGGFDQAPRGRGERCFGFLSDDAKYAHCTREDRAGGLPIEADSQTFAHYMAGECRCGVTHGASGVARKVAARAARIVATFDYPDRAGAPAYQVVKYDDPKSFRVRRSDGNGGWIWNLQGMTRVLYNLPDVLAVAAQGWRIYVTEGEKDADAINALGLCATTNVFGAGKWAEQYSEALRGAEVVVIADRDDVGRKHAREVAASCSGKAKSVRVIELPGDHVKDASDWLSAGGTKAELERLADDVVRTPADPSSYSSPIGKRRDTNGIETAGLPFETAEMLAEGPPAEASWVVEGLLARGAITELAGKVKSAGKTTFALALCRAVLDGRPFAGLPTATSNVTYLTEQSGPTWDEALVRARLWGDPRFGFLRWPRVAGVAWPEIVTGARRRCRETGSGLLIVDTIGRWAGFDGDAENSAGEAMAAMAPLQVTVSEDSIAVLALRHAKKGVSSEVGEDGRGSSAMSGAVDVVLSLRRPAGDAGSTARILLGLSRFGATPESLALRLTPSGYESAGSVEDFALAIAKDALRESLPNTETNALTADELLKVADIPRASGYRALGELVKAGEAGRIGAGKRGDPFRHFRLTEKRDSSHVLLVDETNRNESTAGSSPDTLIGSPR